MARGGGLEVLRRKTKARERFAGHDPCRDLGDRHAGHLGDERHRARGARIDFEHVDVAVLDGVLHVHQAADLERQSQRPRLPIKLGDRLGRQIVRRQRAGGVAGMDSRFFDMLHDAGDVSVLAVGEAVDVDLDRVGQVAIDQQWPRFDTASSEGRSRAAGEARKVAVDLRPVVHDLHSAAAEHVGGADHDRIADLLGDGARLFRRVAMPLSAATA